MARPKVSVIGAGMVGGAVAQYLALRDYADVVLVDIVEGMPQGKALDLAESAPIEGYDCRLTGSNGYKESADSDIVVITSGLARKPGMSRDDLLKANAEIVRNVTKEVVRYSPNAILIIVSNPLDAMCQVALRESGFPKHRVIGMAGVLDSARMACFLAEALDCSVENINAFVMGGHGDTMVPLPRYSTCAGIPITELLPADVIEKINTRTANGGAEIVALLKTGSAYYAPSAASVQMVESILKDKKMILPCAVYLEGEYGINGLYVGVPAKLGARGVEKIIEIGLTAVEDPLPDRSCQPEHRTGQSCLLRIGEVGRCNRFIVIVGQLHQQGLVRRACNEQRRYMLRGNRQHDLIKAFAVLATGQQPAIAVRVAEQRRLHPGHQQRERQHGPHQHGQQRRQRQQAGAVEAKEDDQG